MYKNIWTLLSKHNNLVPVMWKSNEILTEKKPQLIWWTLLLSDVNWSSLIWLVYKWQFSKVQVLAEVDLFW